MRIWLSLLKVIFDFLVLDVIYRLWLRRFVRKFLGIVVP